MAFAVILKKIIQVQRRRVQNLSCVRGLDSVRPGQSSGDGGQHFESQIDLSIALHVDFFVPFI